jgi:hypothetical protein
VHSRGAPLGPSGAGPAVTLELPAVPGATGGLRFGPQPTAPPPQAMPLGGPIVSVPTSVVPPPPMQSMVPGMRPPEAGESNEPQPVGPPNSR